MPKPLAGLRVLELARILAGPWAGQMLADLGADVIKVERKGAGDDTRGWGPPFVEGADGKHLGSAYFHSANRGKRSIEADFEDEEGRRIVHKLVKRSDVLIENFKVGGLAKFGLDYKSLAPENPRLIYCSVTGFGQDGPYASARRLRPDGARHGRHDGPDRLRATARRPASALRSRTFSPAAIRWSASLPRCAQRARPAKAATSTPRWSIRPSACSPTMGSIIWFPAKCRSASAMRTPTSCPIRNSQWPTVTSSSPPATTAQFVKILPRAGRARTRHRPEYKNNVGRLKHRNELVDKLTALTRRSSAQDCSTSSKR